VTPKSSPSSSSIRDDDNPYVGPRAFGDTDPLYGRGRELRELADLLIAERIVVLHSPSGAGKTSLINAEGGLLQELKDMGFRILPPARVNLQPPVKTAVVAGRYAYSIMDSLESASKTKRLLAKDTLSSTSLAEYLDKALAQSSVDDDEPPAPVVLILDQFEEVFTLDPTDADGRRQFFTDLGKLLRTNPIWVLFAMRGDLLGELDGVSHLVPGGLAIRYRLGLLERPAAAEAIIEPPWRRHQITFTPEAAERILNNVCSTLVETPGSEAQVRSSPFVEGVILQTVLLKLWQGVDPVGNGLTVIEPGHLGNLLNHVDRALASHYRESVQRASLESRIPERVIRDWFENQLMTAQGWRNLADKGPGSGKRRTKQCLDVLEAQHIIRSETRVNRQWWEIVHDRFLNPAKEDNRRWRRANDLDEIPAAAQQWFQDKIERNLWPADRLVAASAWLQEHQHDSYEIEREFITQSEKAARNAEPTRTMPYTEAELELLQDFEFRLSDQYLTARRAYNLWWYVSALLFMVVLVLATLLLLQLR
jgi:conflict system STAND superfamily ATPase